MTKTKTMMITSPTHEIRSRLPNEDDETEGVDLLEVPAMTRLHSPTSTTTRPEKDLDSKDNHPIISMETVAEPLTFWKNLLASC